MSEAEYAAWRVIFQSSELAARSAYLDAEALGIEVFRLSSGLAHRDIKIDRLTQQRDELLAALKDCAEDMEDWARYAPEYFRNKHDLEGDILEYATIIAKVEAEK